MILHRLLSKLAIIVLTVSLVSCHSDNTLKEEKTWEDQIKEIDFEIDGLKNKVEETRHRANEEEKKSLLYMRDDWVKYSKEIQKVEKDHKYSLETEQRINELNKKKEDLIKKHSKT